MKLTRFFISSALAVGAVLSPLSVGATSSYHTTYHGDGTYYGQTNGGNCVLRNPVPGMYAGKLPIALNSPQYGNSEMCGACLRVTGNGDGLGANPITGTFYAYVDDKCPECKWGDIDLGKSGDGRWSVSWEFVPCETHGAPIAFAFEGSNLYYFKLQPRNTATPAQRVKINGNDAQRSQDNFWIAHGGPLPQPCRVEVWTMDGTYYDSYINGYHGEVYGSYPSGGSNSGGSSAGSQGGNHGAGSTNGSGGNSNHGSSGSGSGSGGCTSDWQRCAGEEGFPYVEYKPCCNANFDCVQSPEAGYWGKQCRQRSDHHGGHQDSHQNSGSGNFGSLNTGSGACTPDWLRCAGETGFPYVEYKPCCSGNYACVDSPDHGHWGKQCRPM